MFPRNHFLKDRYRILNEIGGGGFGHVYKAIDEVFGCCVAIKETREDKVLTAELRKAFEREAKLLRSLKHECLPLVTDYFFDDKSQFLVMDFVEGEDLATMLQCRLANGDGPFTVGEVLSWADKILSALEYLHGLPEPIIHRDIKPANLKLGNNGAIYLLDFGLAKGAAGQMSTMIDGQPSFSIAGGTRGYSPLEQLQRTGTQSQSDIYALGATLHHLLTVSPPIDASLRDEAIQRGSPDPLRSAHEINPAIPIAISKVIERAMIIRWWNRTASASEMRTALLLASGNLVSTEEIPPDEVLPPETSKIESLPQPAPRTASALIHSSTSWIRKQPSRLAIGFLLLALSYIGFSAAFSLWPLNRSSQPIATPITEIEGTIQREPPPDIGAVNRTVTLMTPIDPINDFIGPHLGVWSVALSPDGTLAVSASENNTIIFWDTKEWKPIPKTLTGHHVVFSPDGNLLAAASSDKKIRLWDVKNRKLLDSVPPFPLTKPVYRMAFSADSGSLALFTAERGNGDADIKIWDLQNDVSRTLKGEPGVALLDLEFSPRSNVLASIAQDNKLRLWNLTENTSEVLKKYPKALTALAFSPDGKYLACASKDQTIKRWFYDSQSRKWSEQSSLDLSQGEISSVAFSPDGTTLVSTGTHNIAIWNFASPQSTPLSIRQTNGDHRSPAFSSDAGQFLTAGENAIWLWR